jgi:sugar phosphate permease
MSFYAIAAGLGGAVLVPMISQSILVNGWRMTAIYCGLAFLIAGLPATFLFRNTPEDMGLLPDGIEPSEYIDPETGESTLDNHEPDITTMEA